MKKIAFFTATIISAVVGVGGILPALSQVHDTGGIPRAFVGSYTLGVFLLTAAMASVVWVKVAKRQVI